MRELPDKHEKILTIVFIILALVTLFITYYRYLVIGDFAYETKSLDKFTEEDFK